MNERFDDAVDRAVREMLDVEPAADLRARVMAELPAAAEAAAGTPAAGFRLPAFSFQRNLVFFAAAAALIVIAIVVARRGEPLPQPPVVAHHPNLHLPGEAVAIVPPSVEIPAQRVARRAGASTASASESQVAGIEPLKTIAPIAVAPIEQEQLHPSEVAVRPLNAIAELQIAPLTPADRRN